MSSLVILNASVFEISCEKNRQTDRQTPVITEPTTAVLGDSDFCLKSSYRTKF